MALRFNPFTKKMDKVGVIPQYDSDPASPSPEDVWVKATVSGGTGGGKLKALFGGGFPILSLNTGGESSYLLSYYTKENTIKRFQLSSYGELAFKSVSSDYLVTYADNTIECRNAITITLPSAIGVSGKIFNIKNTSSGTVTISPSLSQTIDGLSSETVQQYENITVQSNGTNWVIL
jgi:hypothetical protein